MGVCGCERRDKGSACEGVGVPVRKRADLCAESVSVGMATAVNGRGTARRGDGKAEHGCARCKLKESTLTSRHARFCVQEHTCTDTGRMGSRHADLHEYALALIHAAVLSSLASTNTATDTRNS